jgi:hypothetical protein
MLTGLIALMALLSPGRSEGQLPVLEEMERSATETTIYRHVPLVGPVIEQIERRIVAVTWQLEAMTIE